MDKQKQSQNAGKSEFRCSRCRAITTWQDNPYRPFCSARCRSIDLGCWVDEEYRVPGKEGDTDFNNLENDDND